MPDSGGESNEETNEEMEEEPLLFCREALSYGMAIEGAYYPSGKDGTKEGRAKLSTFASIAIQKGHWQKIAMLKRSVTVVVGPIYQFAWAF